MPTVSELERRIAALERQIASGVMNSNAFGAPWSRQWQPGFAGVLTSGYDSVTGYSWRRNLLSQTAPGIVSADYPETGSYAFTAANDTGLESGTPGWFEVDAQAGGYVFIPTPLGAGDECGSGSGSGSGSGNGPLFHNEHRYCVAGHTEVYLEPVYQDDCTKSLTVGPMVFDRYDGCCDCGSGSGNGYDCIDGTCTEVVGPGTYPTLVDCEAYCTVIITTDCCPLNPIPANLCAHTASATGDFACTPSSFPMTLTSPQTSTWTGNVCLTYNGVAYSPTLTITCISGTWLATMSLAGGAGDLLWPVTVSGTPVQTGCDPFGLTLDMTIDTGVVSGTISLTIDATSPCTTVGQCPTFNQWLGNNLCLAITTTSGSATPAITTPVLLEPIFFPFWASADNNTVCTVGVNYWQLSCENGVWTLGGDWDDTYLTDITFVSATYSPTLTVVFTARYTCVGTENITLTFTGVGSQTVCGGGDSCDNAVEVPANVTYSGTVAAAESQWFKVTTGLGGPTSKISTTGVGTGNASLSVYTNALCDCASKGSAVGTADADPDCFSFAYGSGCIWIEVTGTAASTAFTFIVEDGTC